MALLTVFALLLAVLIGISLGLLGGGGSTLAVPVLVYVARLPVKVAIATSLLVVGGAALVGAIRHFRSGNVDGRGAAVFAIVSMVTSYIGARLAFLVDDSAQLIAFALLMLVVAVQMFRAKPERGGGARKPHSLLTIVAVASVVGALTGLLGIGGGFLIVPSLVLFAGLSMKRAIGTSLVVIAANCVSGFAGYAGHVTIDWPLAASFAGVAVAGVFIGTALVHRTNERSLRKGFAVFLILVSLVMLVEKREAFARLFKETPSAAARP